MFPLMFTYYTDKQGWQHYIKLHFPYYTWWGMFAIFMLQVDHVVQFGIPNQLAGMAFVIFFWLGFVSFGQIRWERKNEK